MVETVQSKQNELEEKESKIGALLGLIEMHAEKGSTLELVNDQLTKSNQQLLQQVHSLQLNEVMLANEQRLQMELVTKMHDEKAAQIDNDHQQQVKKLFDQYHQVKEQLEYEVAKTSQQNGKDLLQ